MGSGSRDQIEPITFSTFPPNKIDVCGAVLTLKSQKTLQYHPEIRAWKADLIRPIWYITELAVAIFGGLLSN